MQKARLPEDQIILRIEHGLRGYPLKVAADRRQQLLNNITAILKQQQRLDITKAGKIEDELSLADHRYQANGPARVEAPCS